MPRITSPASGAFFHYYASIPMKQTLKISNLQDMLKYHQAAFVRHQKLFEKHGRENAQFPRWALIKQRADQCKMEFHQQCSTVIQDTLDQICAVDGEMRAQAALAEMSAA